MRFLLGLAWKNLSRYKKRTMITAFAIAVGLGIFIFLDSWLLGLEQESERNLIWYESSYARILNEEYWEEKDQLPLDYANYSRSIYSAQTTGLWKDPEPLVISSSI